MKSTSKTPKLRRFAAVLAVTVALIVAALTPALVVSLVLTQETVERTESTQQAANIDIDETGTVMYSASPLANHRRDTDVHFTLPADILKDADLIKVTVRDDDNTRSFFESQTRDDCSFTLYLSDDDTYTETFTGYLRITDEETARLAGSSIEELEKCGLHVIYAD